MTVEEKLRSVMQLHDAGAPTRVPWPAAEVAAVRHRATSRILVAAALVAVVVAGGAWALVAWPRTSHTPSAATSLSCPTHRDSFSETADVPSQPTVPGAADRLVPDAVPDSVLVCGYVNPGTPVGESVQVPLSGSVELTGDLAAVSAALSSLPGDDGSFTSCGPQTPGAIDDTYLIGLTYPNGTVWVSAPGDSCLGTSNGQFLSPANSAATAARWLEDGAAGTGLVDVTPTAPASTDPTPADPTPSDDSTRVATPVDPASTTRIVPGTTPSVTLAWLGCDTAAGQPGQDSAMVPGSPTSLRICTPAGTPDARTVPADPDQLAEVVAALNGLDTQPGASWQHDCTVPTDGGQAAYVLLFGYADGSGVQVAVQPGCPTAIGNGSLEASDTSTVLPLLESLTR